MDFRAIETVYRGTTFRSRFEANTAQLLDVLGYGWQYEPKSFLLDDGTHYQPDFWVPVLTLWVECRGYRSEKGERQIRGFGSLIRSGRLDEEGSERPPTTWDDDQLEWNNDYYQGPDYMVLRSDDRCEWWEYVARLTAISMPAMREVWLFRCGDCFKWFFHSPTRLLECRLCAREMRFVDADIATDLWVHGSSIALTDAPLDAEKSLGPVAWGRLHGLLPPEGETPQL